MKLNLLLFIFLFLFSFKTNALENCEWDNREGKPCITISKTSNSSAFNQEGIYKKIITKKEIIESGAVDTNDILKLIPGLDVFQSGQKGQQTSIFTRGSESNHTLVLLNGIAINDQSVTDGQHDFGQDFIQTIQQIEIYKGSGGAHFGPSAIAGAINFITDIDYVNSFALNGFNANNNSIDGNYSKITENGWHLNFKGALTQSKTDSAIAKGSEDDDVKNYQINLNGSKWINDNLKLKSTLYSRKTKAGYDSSATKEESITSDNKMYAFQTGVEHVSLNSENSLQLHYHNYDRNYRVQGKTDIYYSESFVAKGEKKLKINEKISYGYGSEYKYDWGNFDKQTYVQSLRGYVKDLGIFANAGYKINENQILSFYGRTDDHNTAGRNETYKLNFTQILGKLKLGITHSTGLRNPSLFELYGSSSTYSGNTKLLPEKSRTNEFYSEYNFSDNLKFISTAYRSSIFDRIEYISTYETHENKILDINQEGIESEVIFGKNDQNFSIFTNFSKSRTSTGGRQNRRPDTSYGSSYSKKFNSNLYGLFNLNLNYKYTGRFRDWDGSKNSFQKSTDILDVSLTKNWHDNIISLNLTNLLNERYEKPATYSQDGRQFRVGFRKSY